MTSRQLIRDDQNALELPRGIVVERKSDRKPVNYFKPKTWTKEER